MNEKIRKLLENTKYKLATVREGGYLIYVDNLKAWEEDTRYGEYNESKDAGYRTIIIKIEGSGFEIENEYNCTGRCYGTKPILRGYHDEGNKIFVGTTISALNSFVGCVRGTSYLYIPYRYMQTKKSLQRKDLKLCYIEDGVAYFTNNPDQWGDDWGDSPYQHNAGTPYLEDGYEVLNIGFYTTDIYSEPCNYFHSKNFSVEEINHKFVPWLTPVDVKYSPVFAGDTIKSFVEKIERCEGSILCGLKFENYDI